MRCGCCPRSVEADARYTFSERIRYDVPGSERGVGRGRECAMQPRLDGAVNRARRTIERLAGTCRIKRQERDNMGVYRWIATLALMALTLGNAAASEVDKSERLVNAHDLTTTVAIGDYYLKQESILAARDFLRRLGAAQNLGSGWTASNIHWKQAEDAIVGRLMLDVKRDFSSLEWLSEEWSRLNVAEFKEQDMDVLLAHFGTDVGRKQVMIVDHSIAFHVISALTLGGRIQENLSGVEADRKRMQDLYNVENREMRFDTDENPEGNRFAMSPTGK